MPLTTIGTMRHRLVLQSPTDTVDSFGQPIRSWATYTTVWAQVIAQGGTEVQQAGQLSGLVTYQVVIRTLSTVAMTHRMIWGTKTLNIQSVIPLDGERKFLRIVAIEEQP